MIVLYVVSTLKLCGPTNQLYGIVKNLDRNFFTPVVLTLSPEPEESRWNDFAALGLELQSLALGRMKGAIVGRRALRERITTIAPAVVHSQGIRADSLCARLLDNDTPHVATLRNYPFKDFVMSYGRIQGTAMAYWHLRQLKRAEKVGLVSKAIQDMLNGRLANTRVVQNGVDIERYFPINRSKKKQLRAQLGLPERTRLFISTGHLDPRKDPLTAIEGFLSVAQESDIFLILGEGGLRKELEARFGTHIPQINFLGRVKNVQEYLQASDYFISASLAEGLPNAVLEALACGLPCLLSDIAEHAEIVDGSHLQHLQFKRASPQSLALLIQNLDDETYLTLSHHAVEIVKANFSAAYMSNQYQTIYRELTS